MLTDKDLEARMVKWISLKNEVEGSKSDLYKALFRQNKAANRRMRRKIRDLKKFLSQFKADLLEIERLDQPIPVDEEKILQENETFVDQVKICGDCGEEKPLEQYYLTKREVKGDLRVYPDVYCIICRKERDRKRYIDKIIREEQTAP